MKVFVSSTYTDLSTHRGVLESSLRMSGYDYNGMEHFGADPTPPITVCLQAVRLSDAFVGILGMRYGSCPNNNKLSYTEREYRLAHSLHLPVYIFIVDEENARIRPQDFDTDPDKIERLRRFKDVVIGRHSVVRFTGEDHLAWQVLASLRVAEIRIREEGILNA